MADANLDDFFAKKDKTKKKAKAKSKGTDGTETGEKLVKKVKLKKKKEEAKPLSTNKDKINDDKNKADDEWNDYEDEDVDYSGLRIQSLQMRDEAEENKDSKEDEGDDSDEERGETGPWAKSGQAPAPVQYRPETPPQPVEIEDKGVEDEVKKPTKYVPPAARAAAAAGGTPASASNTPSGGWRSRQAKKQLPNITSEMDFPTLGGAVASSRIDAMSKRSGDQFEEVRGGGKQIEDPNKRHMQVSLDNKYQALQGNAD